MDAAESRLAENEDHEMIISMLLIQTLQRQSQLKVTYEDLESRARRKNLRISTLPENCEGNNMIEFVERLICKKLEIRSEFNNGLTIITYTSQRTCLSVWGVKLGNNFKCCSSIIQFKSMYCIGL